VIIGAEWWNGGMEKWWNDGMAEWRNGGLAEWRNGGMAEWHNVRYKIVWNQDTESKQMPPWQSPSWLVISTFFILQILILEKFLFLIFYQYSP
jgi:hypothetical protein